jgi:peptide/nickel transport system permease protein
MRPQKIHLFDKSTGKLIGPFVYGIKPERNKETFRMFFSEDYSVINKIKLFHKGERYRLFGIISSDIHLFGADDGPISLMGTDPIGRDMFSRILNGGKLSLSVGLVGVFLSMIFGLLMGGLAGFYGGKVDSVIMRTVDLFMALPTIPLWMGFAAAVPRDWSVIKTYFMITVILSFLGWTHIARVIRGKFLSLREEDFVLASRLSGASDFHIITSHMIPSFISYLKSPDFYDN